MKFHVTYDITTEESAEHGDVAERGFAYPHGGRCELDPDCWGEAAGKVKAENGLTLREALDTFTSRGRLGIEDNGTSFYSADSDINYATGEEERLALHCPDTITAASLARVRRLLEL